jgi:Ras-related protein Rab-8A
MSYPEAFDFTYKIIMIGDCGSGKTSILERYSVHKFESEYNPTIGVDLITKDIKDNGKKYRLQLWDTAGQDRFRNIVSSYYRGIHGAIIVYDITDRKSFQHLNHWVKELREYAEDSVAIIIVGNKCDNENGRKVSIQEGQEYAASINCPFLETSSKTPIFIDEIFTKISLKQNQEDIVRLSLLLKTMDVVLPDVVNTI